MGKAIYMHSCMKAGCLLITNLPDRCKYCGEPYVVSPYLDIDIQDISWKLEDMDLPDPPPQPIFGEELQEQYKKAMRDYLLNGAPDTLDLPKQFKDQDNETK